MTTKTETTTQVYRVYIKATPQAIWDAITKPEWTKRYGMGGVVDYDLRPGGAYRAYPGVGMRKKGAELGFPVPEVAIDGEVIEADPPHKLVQTFRMLMGDRPRPRKDLPGSPGRSPKPGRASASSPWYTTSKARRDWPP
jgi:uncharacterized protein YndB with AHSA1/START domain